MNKRQNLIPRLLLILILLPFSEAFGQEFSKSSIKIGLAAGVSSGYYMDGLGLVYTIGYQKEIWKDRFRFNPNLSIGNYSSKMFSDGRDQYFNSINIEANFYYDIVKVNSFSLVVGCGTMINNSKGLLGTGGMDIPTSPQSSEYFSKYHLGGNLSGGFRINSPNKRTAINILPINIHFGNQLTELNAKIEIDIKL